MSERKIVALVLDEVGLNGDTRYVYDLCRYLDRERYRFHVVSLAPAGSFALEIQKLNVPVHALDLPVNGRIRGAWWTFVGLLKMESLFKSLRPELVHCVGSRADAVGRRAARIAGVPWLVATHRRAFAASGAESLYLRSTSALLDRLIVPTEALRDEAMDRWHVHPARLVCIPAGVDLGYSSGAIPATFPGTRPRILVVARLVPELELENLFEAAALLARFHSELQVVVVGGGPAGLAFLRASQRRGLEKLIHFTGEREDIPEVLAASDVLVHPGGRSTSSTVILEAFAAKVPIVAVRTPSLPDGVINDESALLVPQRHAALLANALDRLLVDDDLRRRLVDRGSAVVRAEHLALRSAERVGQLYAELLGTADIAV